MEHKRQGAIDQSGATNCPSCEERAERIWSKTTFRYGSGTDAVDIPVTIPVIVCDACEEEFIDEEGEVLMHEALCEHLGIITPREIQETRESYGLSCEEFARITGIDEATLGRWERGAGIQTRAYDLYLKLLKDGDVFEKLKTISPGD